MDKCSKLFSLILCSLILAFLFTSTPIFKFKIFESTHSNLIRIKDFNILNYKIECSSPWGRGRDTTATMKVSYNYKYNDKSYEAEFIDFYSKLTKIIKHAKRNFWLNDICTCHGLLPSHSA